MHDDVTNKTLGSRINLPLSGMTLDLGKEDLREVSGKRVELRPQAFQVLRYLVLNAGCVTTKDELHQAIWPDTIVTDDSLVQAVSDLRRVLGDADHNIIKTVPRRGYKLVADAVSHSEKTENSDENNRTMDKRVIWGSDPLSVTSPTVFKNRTWAFGMMAVLLFVTVLGANWDWSDEHTVQKVDLAAGTPLLSIKVQASDSQANNPIVDGLLPELRVALSRYRTVQLTDKPEARYQLRLNPPEVNTTKPRLTVELFDNSNASLVFAETYEIPETQDVVHHLGVRVAAAIASPGVGAVGRHLISTSRLKPVEELTQAECYAHGFGCAKCSGEEDNITKRAEACLAYMIEQNPDDSRAWALQASIYAHQYLWGTTLKEPQRSSLKLRRGLENKAIDAANKSEALSNGDDSAIYWSMAEAYFSSCQADKLHTAVQRGLEINPDDPNLLASFGNWLTYSGRWDEGAALTRRALEIEPHYYRKWWWMGIAKNHYFKEEFGEAYSAFMKSFNERNWLSHLQLAYTLPFLDRIPEARTAVDNLERLYPGVTMEKALEIYKILCFPDSFLENMKQALTLAGLSSRGDSQDFDSIDLPRARTISANGIDIEYLIQGKGESVLFVHGSISDYRTWGQYLAPISEDHRYISYSRRYFGTQPWKDGGEKWSNDVFADDLIGLIEALNVGAVHLVTWSSGVRPALIASINRPDLFKSALHFEPVDNNIFSGDDSIKTLQGNFFELWNPFFELLRKGDEEAAAEKMLELVFEFEPGEFGSREREGVKELVRQNARTLPVYFSGKDRGDTKITCDYVNDSKVPTKIVLGGETHEYWSLMAKRFARCIPNAEFEKIEGVNHRGPIEAVDRLSEMIDDFVIANK